MGGRIMKKNKLHTYYVKTFCVNTNYISTKGGKIRGKRKKKTKEKKGGGKKWMGECQHG